MSDNKVSQRTRYMHYVETKPRTKVGVVCDSRRRAGRSRVVRAGAAVRVVHGITEPGFARALAPNGEARGVVWTFERGRTCKGTEEGSALVSELSQIEAPLDQRTVGAEVDRTVGNATAFVVVDPERQVVAVDEGH